MVRFIVLIAVPDHTGGSPFRPVLAKDGAYEFFLTSAFHFWERFLTALSCVPSIAGVPNPAGSPS